MVMAHKSLLEILDLGHSSRREEASRSHSLPFLLSALFLNEGKTRRHKRMGTFLSGEN
jgi:hypothetical protein